MLKNTQLARKASESIGNLFKALPFHPTTYTILSVIFALVGLVSWTIGFESRVLNLEILGFVLFVLALFIDAIDGAVARAKNLVSKQGAFLDGISDRIVEFFIVLSLLFAFATNMQIIFVMVAILFFGTCMTSFVKAYAEHSGLMDNETAKKMPGFLERAERVVLLMIAVLLVILQQTTYATYVIGLIAVFSFATFMQRAWLSMR